MEFQLRCLPINLSLAWIATTIHFHSHIRVLAPKRASERSSRCPDCRRRVRPAVAFRRRRRRQSLRRRRRWRRRRNARCSAPRARAAAALLEVPFQPLRGDKPVYAATAPTAAQRTDPNSTREVGLVAGLTLPWACGASTRRVFAYLPSPATLLRSFTMPTACMNDR